MPNFYQLTQEELAVITRMRKEGMNPYDKINILETTKDSDISWRLEQLRQHLDEVSRNEW